MSYQQSRDQAERCPWFVADDEDEQVDDHPRSCVNCAYRRWLPRGYQCRHPQQVSADRGQ